MELKGAVGMQADWRLWSALVRSLQQVEAGTNGCPCSGHQNELGSPKVAFSSAFFVEEWENRATPKGKKFRQSTQKVRDFSQGPFQQKHQKKAPSMDVTIAVLKTFQRAPAVCYAKRK